jgi:diguanylate cyclase (GGDEF)-like protein/PAS domain S-box-containing protein
MIAPGADYLIRLLHIEDQLAEATLIREMLSGLSPGFLVHQVDRLALGLEQALTGEFDVALLDLCLPDSAGIDTFQQFHGKAPQVPVIVMTNMADENLAATAVREGAQDYLIKRQVDPDVLVRSIRYAIERRRYEEALLQSEERYALAVRGSNDGVWDWDLLTGDVYFSPRWKEILGYSDTELGNSLDSWFAQIHPDDIPGFEQALQAHLSGSCDQFVHEYRIRHNAGEYVWVLSRGLAVRDAHGSVLRIAGSLTDVSVRKNAEEKLLNDALHDALTRLPNRVLLRDRLAVALKELRRRGGIPFAVMFLDLDRFKNVNDSLGHSVGDDLLVAFSKRLSRLLRPGDTVARLGGDEFAIIISNIRDLQHVRQIADRILDLSREPYVIGREEIFISVSIGIALGAVTYRSPEEILRDADIAMYRAKAEGKSRYALFDSMMYRRVVEVVELEGDLRRALDRGELTMYYQPIISLREARVVGFEALMRWNHPRRGLILPGDFIPCAEEIGLIVPMGWWSIREVCARARQWERQRGADHELSVSVNVSGRLFAQADFISRLAQIMDEADFRPGQLCIEITESVLLDHAEDAKAKLKGLRGLGVSLHIDDFGTGYSSLSYLSKFDYDSLKIDRSFVKDLNSSPDSAAIVQMIITLGGLLGMNVIAEGVETPDQLQRLQELNCPAVQGYWFSPPVDTEGVRRLLQHSPGWPLDRIA